MFSNFSWEIVAHIFLALLAGSLVGYEREKEGKAAGLRTHILVCIGATLMTSVALAAHGISDGASRIVQGTITGIGFVGAGTIIFSGKNVRGLTTAASIWVTASIGIAIGYEFYIVSILSALIVFSILSFGIFKDDHF